MKQHVSSLLQLLDEFTRKRCLPGPHISEDCCKPSLQTDLDKDVGERHVMFFGEIEKIGVRARRERFFFKS